MSQNLNWTPAQYEEYRRRQAAAGRPVAGLSAAVTEPPSERSLVNPPPTQKKASHTLGRRSKRPVLSITLVAARRPHAGRDSDNWSKAGYKELRDTIARWFGLDDNDSTICWKYEIVPTVGQQGTIVMVEELI